MRKLPLDAPIPDDLGVPHFIAYTATELSVIAPGGTADEKTFRLIEIAQTFGTTETGVLVQLLNPLAAAGVWVVTIGTHDTDYILVRADQAERAVAALEAAGHRFQ